MILMIIYGVVILALVYNALRVEAEKQTKLGSRLRQIYVPFVAFYSRGIYIGTKVLFTGASWIHRVHVWRFAKRRQHVCLTCTRYNTFIHICEGDYGGCGMEDWHGCKCRSLWKKEN